MTESQKHARLSPSSASRFLNCPPSLVLSEQFSKEPESSYAAEGSAGHALAEHLIREYLGETTSRPESEYYTPDLIAAVQEYVDFAIAQINEARRRDPQALILVEEKLGLEEYLPDCFGTADLIIVEVGQATVIDLKLGSGIQVFAEQNNQLMIYGLGVLSLYNNIYDFDHINLKICQPRLNHLDEWQIPTFDLEDWGLRELTAKGLLALEGGGEFKAGQWCRFCLARYQCRERAEENLKLTRLDFKEPPLLTETEMAEVLIKSKQLRSWTDDVFKFATEQAINEGRTWPGFKLVEGRSQRKITDEKATIKALKAQGFRNSDFLDTSLKGITALESLLGKKRFQEILSGFVEKPPGKLSLVQASDNRPEVVLAPAPTVADDFEEDFIPF